ncbi:universal stress protein [Natronorubrum texcoconense]|uniref:Nucleotide-binding universal stress protein, UspA family n=1 Tax=Natronorubrum texcoconense TaxID=1095776 RepID=A0A1G8XRF8_9EURY|nr:universal stress protein [Natronorubrum texcoconense]SDJ93047.1 Nucleotide-binding universal stress protein, UspA family [Natronorubrum texcoconense]
MYDTILVPTDGSDVAANAVHHAIDLAEKYDAAVHALYVVDTSAMDISLGTEQVDRIRQGKYDEMPEVQERANKATGSVASQARERGLEVTESVVAGQPHSRIADYAANHDVDLIVMGSAGRGGVKRVLLGSVAERTLRTTDIPVLVVDIRED